MRTVKITPVLNGFRVEVGCQELVFSSIEKLCEELIRYQKDPSVVELEYLKNAVNSINRVQTLALGFDPGPNPEVEPSSPQSEDVPRERNR